MDVKAVVDAAAIGLALAFPGKTVYAEKVEQGFERPCFFVSATEAESPLMGERAARTLRLAVDYHGEEEELAREEAAEIGARLALVLEWLEIGNLPKRAQAMGHECDEGGSLHWKADYLGHVFKHRPQEKMRVLHKELKVH